MPATTFDRLRPWPVGRWEGFASCRPEGGRRAISSKVSGGPHPRRSGPIGLADSWLSATCTDLQRGSWVDPEAGKVALADYAVHWLANRPELRPRTQEFYRSLLRLHILPALGGIQLADLSPAKVRSWRAGLIDAGHPGAPTIAKAYQLLHAICATALEDGLVTRNPCVIKGASVERPAERPVASIEQVYAIADAIEPRSSTGS